MDWTAIGDAVVAQIVMPVLLAVIGVIGAWLVTKVPGPLRDFLQSGTHQRDMELLLGVIARGAKAAILAGMTDRSAVTAAVGYAAKSIPETLEKLGPSTQTLETMAAAAVTDALTKAKAALPAAGQ